ncbi:MAG TPA: EpsD family peptidyl-prolyl cis-trans isomerase [Burkholderiales bacterium]|nr:EpsD family peptidyl-prolyl cis-trans isomerase [Burkholderiales bacterium]
MTAPRAWIGGLAGLVLAGGLAGCGGSTDANAGAAGRLAARVNGTEITMQQVGPLRAGNPLQALDKVIDRELLVQKALEAKLDREPRVVQAIEESRRQLLAQAWLEHTAAERARPSGEEVRAFYEENPALFAQRRIYKIREITVAGASDRMEMLRAEIATARDLEDVAGWLKWRNLKVSAVTGTTQAAEHLPLGYLPQLSRMKEGELAVFPSSLGATVIQLVHAQEAPLSEREATPLIEQFLSGRKRLELAAAEVKRLRGTASIEYVGDFKR